MLHGVLNVFDKIVREIMTPRTDMVCIEFKSSLNEVVQLITQKGHSRIPVYEDKIDNITGFVYAKDLLNLDPSIKTYNLKSFMREAVFIPETKNLKDLLHQMKSSKLHLAIVVDEHGGVSGLVTLEDIIEEIVGEIHDEYDNEEPNIKQLQTNEYIVDAGIGIEQLGTKLNIKCPEDDDYDTLAGFILSFLGTFPNKNQSFDYQNVHFTIKSIKKRRIISVGLKISVQKVE